MPEPTPSDPGLSGFTYSMGRDPATLHISPVHVTVTGNSQWICPDLLSIRQIGGADGWRGRVVRAFFRLLKLITGV